MVKHALKQLELMILLKFALQLIIVKHQLMFVQLFQLQYLLPKVVIVISTPSVPLL